MHGVVRVWSSRSGLARSFPTLVQSVLILLESLDGRSIMRSNVKMSDGIACIARL